MSHFIQCNTDVTTGVHVISNVISLYKQIWTRKLENSYFSFTCTWHKL